ncbi:hypothetical protein QOT17_018981 [Balamuthia mandrillaris]
MNLGPTLSQVVHQNPHASLAVLFLSAFALFALTGEENILIKDKRRFKQKSLFGKLFLFFGTHDCFSSSASLLDDSSSSSGDQGRQERILSSSTASSTSSSLASSQDGSSSSATGARAYAALDSRLLSTLLADENMEESTRHSLALLIKDLEHNLHEERQARDRLQDTLRKEEALRLEVEQNFELVQQEMENQRKHLNERLRREKEFSTKLEKMLDSRDRRVEELEAKLKKKETEVRDLKLRIDEMDNEMNELSAQLEEEEEEKEGRTKLNQHNNTNGFSTHQHENNSNNSEEEPPKKRIFTII